jgi:hypothetical protein
MYVITNFRGEKFNGYCDGFMFWGYDEVPFLTYEYISEAVSVVKSINTAPYGKNRHPQAKIEPLDP